MAKILWCFRYWSTLVRLQANCVSEDLCIHCPFHRGNKIISWLMLGYTLNKYKYIIGLHESPLRSPCAIEIVNHKHQTGEQSSCTYTFHRSKDEVFKEHGIGLLMKPSDYMTLVLEHRVWSKSSILPNLVLGSILGHWVWLAAVLAKSCVVHISYILWGRDPIVDVLVHFWVANCFWIAL